MKKLLLTLLLLALPQAADAARLKELVDVRGFRTNHLVGVGLVVGLSGTGDNPSSIATRQPLATIMRNLGSAVTADQIRAKNVALVMVTADLPPFSRPGVHFDVTVSSMGTAKSLQGGTLIATALKGIDRQTYAMAQGALTVGGYEVRSQTTGSFRRKNQVAVGRIPGGGIVEREIPQTLPTDKLSLLLREPDFTTAERIKAAINQQLGEGAASVQDAGLVEVTIAEEWKPKVVGLIAKLEAVQATPDARAKVVIDERTGTVVVGAQVTLGPAAISYGGLTIQVTERFAASQPIAPFGAGETTVVPSTDLDSIEQNGEIRLIAEAPTLADVTNALNALKVKPRDMVVILQALRAAGALRAEIDTL